MPPKKGSPSQKTDLKATSKTGEETEKSSWRSKIINTKLNDATFRVKVVLLDVAGSEQDRMYLNKFELFAAEEKRFVIKILSKTETIFMISQLGHDTKGKEENKVFEEAAAFMREKKNVPADYLALVIKHLIIKFKEEYLFIKRQKLDVAEGCRRESLIMERPVEVKGSVFHKGGPSTLMKSDKSKTAVVAPTNKPSRSDNDENLREIDDEKKYNTQLRVRGEEWRDKQYVEDYPIDGPHLYVAVTGFADPFLPLALVRIGVPMVAVVQIRIDVATLRIPSSLTRAAKRGASQTQLMMDESLKFWDDLQQLRILPSTAPYLKDTAFIVFSPLYWETKELTGDAEKIYDEVSYLIYDTHDLSRQHQNFLDNMRVINVPVDKDESKDKFSCFQYYSRLLQGIPLECLPIYTVLDSIIHSVVKFHNGTDSESNNSTADVKSEKRSNYDEKLMKAESIVNDIFDKLCQADNNKKTYRVTYGEEFETYKDPIVLNYGDIVKYNTFHLGNMNLDQIVCGMLLGMPVNKLWQKEDALWSELEAKISFHINVLLSCFEREDVETSELVRLLNILAFRKLYNNRSSLRKDEESPETLSDFKKNYLKRSPLAEPITRAPSVMVSCGGVGSPSFPSITKSDNVSTLSPGRDDDETSRVKFLFDCPDISDLVTGPEIEADTPLNHLIDDYDFFEDFEGSPSFQIILDSFNKYNCLDYKYCEVTDSIVMMFFNSHNKEGIARDTWRSHIPTAVCLQDFFDYVLEEHYDWIQEQDELYYEALALMTRSMYSKHMLEQYEHSCLNEIDVDMEMMLDGSLKHQEMIEAATPLTSTDNIPSRHSTSPKIETRKSTPRKSIKEKAKEPQPDNTPKTFCGYMLGDRRIEVFGKDSTYFSKDGCKINTMYYLVIPMNFEWIIMNLVTGNGNNEFWFQRVIGDHLQAGDNAELSENFRINTKDQVMINLKKVTYRVLLTKSPSKAEYPPSPTFRSSFVASPVDELYETEFYHKLYVTWPNGMIVESVHEINSPTLSHIRMTYLSDVPHIKEEMRCYTLKGEAVIFHKAGNIKVLCPDGTYINITKYGQRQVFAPTSSSGEPNSSETDSKKGKKEDKKKGKEDKSDKKGKGASPSKSNKASTQNLSAHEGSLENEFGIDEFDIVDTCGIVQRYNRSDKKLHKTDKLLIKTATDYCLGEVFMRRTDGAHYLLNKNGSYVSTFPDGTRIVSDCFVEDEEIFPEWTEEERAYFDTQTQDMVEVESMGTERSTLTDGSANEHDRSSKKPKPHDDGYVSIYVVYTIEHKNYATITINNFKGTVQVDSPNGTSVVMDRKNHYQMKLDDVTTAKFDGLDLYISYEACVQCHSFTTCDVKISYDEVCSVTQVYRHWLRMKDSFCKRVFVNEEGDISLTEEPCSDPLAPNVGDPELEGGDGTEEVEAKQDEGRKSEGSVNLHGKCRDIYTANTMKFFVLRRDQTCSELVHRSRIEEYRKKCLWQPWCHIDTYDTFGDHRRIVSIVSPINVTETEKWLMESRLCSKPTRLTYKDLKEDSCKKGFYHWMRPHGSFQPKPVEPDSVLPPRLPRAFVLRTLEQQWCDEERPELKGARELLRAILKYRRVMEEDCRTILHVPICDPRTRDQADIDEKIQLLGMSVYRDLKERLNQDLRRRMKRDITTAPLPAPEEMGLEGEEESIEQRAEEHLRQLDEIQPMSENMARYWRRRAEELNEEEFYRYLLRKGSVPPYFRNILGGAIWWEVNAAAGDAVTQGERRRAGCLCAEDDTRTTDRTYPTPAPSGEGTAEAGTKKSLGEEA